MRASDFASVGWVQLFSPTPAVERRLPPPVHYTLHSAALTAKRFSFVIFSVGMPLIL